MRHAAMTLNRYFALFACFLVGCATRPDESSRVAVAGPPPVVVERASGAEGPLVVGRPLASRDAPCEGFRATSYSTRDPEGTRRLICISREEMNILYAPDPPSEVDREAPISETPPSATVFEVEDYLPNLQIHVPDP